MYLTDAQKGVLKTEKSNLEDLELLLESFEKQVEEVISEIDQICANVNNTQEIVELILDSNRNRLLTLDLGTSIVTLGVSAATLFVGLFGMNLTSHLEEHPHAFYLMSGVAYVMALLVSVAGLRRLARLRRIGLSVGGSSTAAFGAQSPRKPDAHLVSHARAWWWRENQFRAMQRKQSQHHAHEHLRSMDYAMPSSDPLDPAELNAGPSPHGTNKNGS